MTKKGTSKENIRLLDFIIETREHDLFKSRKIKDIASSFDSPKNVERNLRRMVKNRIGKVSASINHRKLNIITALVLIKTVQPSYNKLFFEHVSKIPFVENVTQVVGGEATHIITIKVPTLELVGRTVEKIRGEFLGSKEAEGMKNWIEWTTTKIIYEYALDQKFLYNTIYDKDFSTSLNEKTIKLDCKDFKLLGLLGDNALTPLKELGEKIGLEAPTVLRRISMLEKSGVINGYYCKHFWGHIPFEIQPLTLYLFIRYKGAIPSVSNFVKNISNLKKAYVTDIYYLHGEADLSIMFRVKSVSDFHNFLNSKIMNSENIAQVKIYTVTHFMHRSVLHDFAEWAKGQEK